MRETFTSGSVGRAPGNRCLYPECSGREGLNLAGASPVVPMARCRHVAIPQSVVGNHTFMAWCKRPGCPEDCVPLRLEHSGGLARGGACTSRHDCSPAIGSSWQGRSWRELQRAEPLARQVRPRFCGKKRAGAPQKRGGVRVHAPPQRLRREHRERPLPSRGMRQPAKTGGPSHRA